MSQNLIPDRAMAVVSDGATVVELVLPRRSATLTVWSSPGDVTLYDIGAGMSDGSPVVAAAPGRPLAAASLPGSYSVMGHRRLLLACSAAGSVVLEVAPLRALPVVVVPRDDESADEFSPIAVRRAC